MQHLQVWLFQILRPATSSSDSWGACGQCRTSGPTPAYKPDSALFQRDSSSHSSFRNADLNIAEEREAVALGLEGSKRLKKGETMGQICPESADKRECGEAKADSKYRIHLLRAHQSPSQICHFLILGGYRCITNICELSHTIAQESTDTSRPPPSLYPLPSLSVMTLRHPTALFTGLQVAA